MLNFESLGLIPVQLTRIINSRLNSTLARGRVLNQFQIISAIKLNRVPNTLQNWNRLLNWPNASSIHKALEPKTSFLKKFSHLPTASPWRLSVENYTPSSCQSLLLVHHYQWRRQSQSCCTNLWLWAHQRPEDKIWELYSWQWFLYTAFHIHT